MIQKYFMLFCFFVLLALPSHADRRSYVWTYEYVTMPAGMAEIEYYNTLEYPNSQSPKVSTWKHWLEYEYGLTDYWDVSMYQQFKQTNTAASKTLSYDGFKIRTRYRIGEGDLYIVDPLLYFELIGPNDLSKPFVFEGKLILAKSYKGYNLAYNQIFKQALEQNGAAENEYAAGISYEFNPSLKISLEGKGSYTSSKHYFGPTISLAREKFWVNFGTAFGVTSNADNLQTRLLMGINI